ncbi:MAG TPA: efflux transporter outer membrane subunit [Steroidobacteraceae bacterium]|jgi:NodT family efflux transporter outer membrane factor (OMF) lipoprotein
MNPWRAAAVGLALLTGCAVGPNYSPPHMDVPAQFVERTDAQRSPLVQWWGQFGDAELQSLVQRALQSNLDLQTAASRIRQAREQVIVAGAAGLPQVSATGAAVNVHANSNPLGQADTPVNLKVYSAGFDATWELDVFGAVRRGVEAARAAEEAAEWQLRDAQVSLSAEVAVDYLSLCATRERIKILRDTLDREQQTLSLTDARRKAGFVSELDVNRQRAQLASTQAQLPALESEARAMVRSLTVLLARVPEDVPEDLTHLPDQFPNIPTSLPEGLPSDLLRRRPDVRSAERRLEGATAEVGVAVASLYPRFDLIAAATYASDSLSGLVSSRNFARAGIGLIRWPVFQAGKGRANVRAREEQRQQAYLAYQKTVLTALEDSENALARLQAEQQRLTALQDAENAAESSLTIARAQYQNGVVPFLDVLSAESALLDAQNQVIQSRLSLGQAGASLYKALGGDWTASPPANMRPSS